MDVANRSFTILGAGRSGIAAAKLLKRKGARVFLSDGSEKKSLKNFNEDVLKKEGIEYELGKHSDRIYESEIFIKSPGITPYSEVMLKANKLNKKIYSEIEAAYWFCKSPVIAITGTNGKTTTTVMTGEIFKDAGFDVKVCGNVGLAFSEVVDELQEDSVVVLEVSSFQLNDIKEFRPRIAVLLNITTDHIDWHGSFENYLDAKLNITRNQNEEDYIVLNYDDDILKNKAVSTKAAKAYFSIKENLLKKDIQTGSFTDNDNIIYFDKTKSINEAVMNRREINIRGSHNLYNSLASIISARSFEIKKEIISEALKKFPGVEHRIEFVRNIDGVNFYNDSKATNIDSLIVALEAFEGKIILILGGRETDNDYSRIGSLVKDKAIKIIAIGESKEKVYNYFKGSLPTIKAETFEDAVKKAFESAQEGDNVLLSPACKSFDMFDSFEHRGKEFKRLVNNLKSIDAEK